MHAFVVPFDIYIAWHLRMDKNIHVKFNGQRANSSFLLPSPSFLVCFGHFDLFPVFASHVYGAKRGTSPLSANKSQLRRIREVYAHNKRKMRARGGRRDGRRWITAATRTDVNEDFLTTGRARLLARVSSNPRPGCVL